MDYRIVLVNGDVIELRRAEVIKSEPDLVFRCGRSEYRFNWNLVIYYTEIHRQDPF